MRHRVHDLGGCLFGSPHSATDTDRSAVLPTKVRERPNEHHDALHGVLVLEALSSEVRGRVARSVVGDGSRCIPAYLIGFCNAKPPLTGPGFSSDSNGRSLLFQRTFSSPFFVQHLFCLTESVNSFGRNVSGVLRSQGLLPIEGEAKTLEKCFPTRRTTMSSPSW